MAKQANRMMIGGFVVLAVIIMAASLVVFGSGKFFQKTVTCVMYFDESVKGLSVGAPVLFQGVQIGSVTSIVLQVDPANLQPQIPVFIEFEPEKFKVREEGRIIPRDPRENIPKLIEKGLRAQLVMQSFITGQLMIELDFHPSTPVVLKNIDKDYIEIPTIMSTGERLAEALGDLDLKGIEKHLLSALASIDRLVSSPDLAASLRALKDTLQDARKLVTKVDGQVDPVAGDLKKTLKDIGKLSNNIDSRVGGVTTGFDKTMSSARGVISPDSPLMVELENTLKEISTMSRAIRQLASYLDEHPESLLRGKKDSGKKDPGKKSSGGK
jgi:paraquat-inducible protein B